jgi:hypothetical protein
MHECDTPATGIPLDEWTCLTCNKRWWATLEWPDDEFLEWREQEMGRTNMPDETPTLGEIAKLLHDLKDRGVTLESLLWVAKEQVWWDAEHETKNG